MTLKYTKTIDEDDEQSLFEYFDWLDDVGRSAGIKHTVWSGPDYYLDFDEIAFPATVKRIYHPWVTDSYVTLKPNATWLDVWKQCDKLTVKSGDIAHYFIEDFTIRNDGKSVTFFAGS